MKQILITGGARGIGFGIGQAMLEAGYAVTVTGLTDEEVSAVPARLYPANFLLVAVAAILLCIGAALYPAWQARSLSPVEVLRYE